MDKRTIDSYNAKAQEYADETLPFWNDHHQRRVLENFAACIPAGGSVLNVGSGPGYEGVILRDLGLNVVCVDASDTMIDLSRSHQLESVLGDLLELPFDESEFDGVWAYTSLLHVPRSDYATALQEATRVLKPDGVLGLGMIAGNGQEYRDSMGAAHERLFSYFEPHELESSLKKAGYEIAYSTSHTPKKRTFLSYIGLRDPQSTI